MVVVVTCQLFRVILLFVFRRLAGPTLHQSFSTLHSTTRRSVGANNFQGCSACTWVRGREMSDDEDAQENELLALESIFENDKDIISLDRCMQGNSTTTGKSRSGRINIAPDIINPPFEYHCKYLTKSPEPNEDSNENQVSSTCCVSYLPPICLRFLLPQDYPSKSPPNLTLTCVWLDRRRLSLLAKKLDSIWIEQEGQEVLYTWSQFLKEDVLDFLSSKDEITINQKEFMDTQHNNEDLDQRVMQEVGRFSDVLPFVQEFDIAKQREVFNSTPFPCDICFTEKYGRNCIKFKDCGHVYCDACLKSYFDIHIKDGNVKALTCPDPGCDSQAFPAQIKNLVSAQDFERYEALLLQTTLDMMTDVVYCPRTFCQSPVVIEDGEVMGLCSVCRFSFCTYCKLVYHGVEPCKLKQEKLKEVCQEYQDGNSATKKSLEEKYGAKVLRQTIDNMESERWLATNSKSCPGCGAAVEKQSGCNKMTCYKCKCYFCWLCMHRLSLANPYSHFNTFNSRCYNKLFDGVVDDEFPDLLNWL